MHKKCYSFSPNHFWISFFRQQIIFGPWVYQGWRFVHATESWVHVHWARCSILSRRAGFGPDALTLTWYYISVSSVYVDSPETLIDGLLTYFYTKLAYWDQPKKEKFWFFLKVENLRFFGVSEYKGMKSHRFFRFKFD